MHLLETPPEIFDHMIRLTLGTKPDQEEIWASMTKEILGG